MPRFLLAALIFCLLPGIGFATLTTPAVLSPGQQCRAAIGAAERGHAIPAQLMAAIGRVESGRRDPGTGAWGAWPWTINAEGQGFYFETKEEAVRAVEALRARGVRSIDVGCMQVNLMHHPTAFATLDQAFDPAINADYAAQFLLRLHGQEGDWTKATADYHSANPSEGGPYADKVLSVWPEEQRKAGQTPMPMLASGLRPGGVSPIARTISPFPARQPPRLLTMGGGMRPGMTPPMAPLAPGIVPSRTMVGMMRNAPPPPMALPSTMPAGMGGAPYGQATSSPGTGPANGMGRGLAFYRAAPIGMAPPVRFIWGRTYRLAAR
jgi:hypothetical protein